MCLSEKQRTRGQPCIWTRCSGFAYRLVSRCNCWHRDGNNHQLTFHLCFSSIGRRTICNHFKGDYGPVRGMRRAAASSLLLEGPHCPLAPPSLYRVTTTTHPQSGAALFGSFSCCHSSSYLWSLSRALGPPLPHSARPLLLLCPPFGSLSFYFATCPGS